MIKIVCEQSGTITVDIPSKEVYNFHFKGIDKDGWKRDVNQVIVNYDNRGYFVDLTLVDDNGVKITSARKKFKIVGNDIIITDYDKNDVVIGHIVGNETA